MGTRARSALIVLLSLFFALFLFYPLLQILSRGLIVDGTLTLEPLAALFRNPADLRLFIGSLYLATVVTVWTSLIGVPLALLTTRYTFPCKRFVSAAVLVPLILPPFVGALGMRQLLGRFGTVNLVLLDLGLLDEPIRFLGGGTIAGVVVMQVLHLVPILYLTVAASAARLDHTLEEAAATLGARPRTVLRRIVLPLLAPGFFAGASMVFIASLTDLGTPLLFELREVIAVRLYEMVSSPHDSPEAYALILLLCLTALGIFAASFRLLPENIFAPAVRGGSAARIRALPLLSGLLVGSLLSLYCLIALLPHFAVVLTSLSGRWFMSPFPAEWTMRHYRELLTHPLTVRGAMNSLFLASVATALCLLLGFAVALIRARGGRIAGRALDLAAMLPLAIPGIVFAFAYSDCFAHTVLDNRVNPLPLLVIAYAVRRLPQMVRSADAGFRESSRALEEAAATLGAPPRVVTWRITVPLLKRHLLAGAILTFSFSMLEVSDSLILALEERYYPISKAIYALVARPDGAELASALGTVTMILLGCCFLGARMVLNDRRGGTGGE